MILGKVWQIERAVALKARLWVENTNNGVRSYQELPEKASPVFYEQFILVAVKDIALVIFAEIAARHDVINLVLAGSVFSILLNVIVVFCLHACFVIGPEPVTLFDPYP